MDKTANSTLLAMWERAEADRGARPVSTVELLAAVASGDLEGEITTEILEALLTTPSQRKSLGESFSSLAVTQFLIFLSRHLKPDSVLDPMCGSGFMLQQVVEATSPSVADAVEINYTTVQIARALLRDQARVIHGDVFAVQSALNNDYDLIVADAPLGCRIEKKTAGRTDSRAMQSGDLAEAICVWAADRLT